MEGFYKKDENGSWLFASNFVYAKDYVLEKNGNREEVDGWKWYDEEPMEYTVFKIKQNTDKNTFAGYETNN